MDIKTVFAIGAEVYFLDGANLVKGMINGITTDTDDKQTTVLYKFTTADPAGKTIAENQLFASVSDLTNALVANETTLESSYPTPAAE